MKKLFSFSLALSILCGCTAVGLVPVEGPMSAQTPLPVATVVFLPDYYISITLPHGEAFRGQYQSSAHIRPPASDGGLGMTGTWNKIYGDSFYMAKVVGHEYWAVLTGDKGTVLHVYFITSEGRHPEVGVAVDDKGNTFKLG